MQVRSLGWEDTLGKEMTIHFSILDWKIPWTEEPGWLQSMGSCRVGQDSATKQQMPSSIMAVTNARYGWWGPCSGWDGSPGGQGSIISNASQH